MAQPEIDSFTFRRTRTRTYDTQNDPNALLTSLLEIVCPAGTIIPALVATEPGEGWKLCNGQKLSKIGFSRLYAIIGGTFGEDADTFTLPDLRGRAPFGVDDGHALASLGGASQILLTTRNLPSHTHAVTDTGHTHGLSIDPHEHNITDPGHDHGAVAVDPNIAATGAFASGATTGGTTDTATTGITVDPANVTGQIASSTTGITVEAAGGGQPVDVMPPHIRVNWLVRT